jgi:transposase-like protein
VAEEYAAVEESTTLPITGPTPGIQDVLTELPRDGARRLLAEAVEAEVAAWIEAHAHLKDPAGRRQVVRNGHLPEREIQTGLGDVVVKQPRVHDRRPAPERERFTSAILPPYLRRTRSLEDLIPWLYLKGVSTGDFSEALQALLGPEAPGLSATTITRLKGSWEDEFATWGERSLEGERYVYVWADGVHFNIRLEGGRQCILVLMGATAEGKKGLIAVADGYRESEQSWKELLLDVKARGLSIEPSRAEPRHRRRGVGLLEGDRAGLALDAGAAMLGPQDLERPG